MRKPLFMKISSDRKILMEKDSGNKKINHICNVKENLNHFGRILSIIEQTNTSNEEDYANTSNILERYEPDYLQNTIFKNEIHDIHYQIFARSPRLTKRFLDKIYDTESRLFGRFQKEKLKNLQDEILKNNYYFTSYIVHYHLKNFFSSENDCELGEKTEPEPTAFEYTYYCLHILENNSTYLYKFLKDSKYFKLMIQIFKGDQQININNEDIEYYFNYTKAYDPIMFVMYALTEYKKMSLSCAYLFVYDNILKKMDEPLSTIKEETATYLYLIYKHCKNYSINQTIEKYITYVYEKILKEDQHQTINEKAPTYLNLIFPHYKNDYISESIENRIKSELTEELKELNANTKKMKDDDIIYRLIDEYKLYQDSNTIYHIYDEDYYYEIHKLTNENILIEQKQDNNVDENNNEEENNNDEENKIDEKNDIHKLLFLKYLFTKTP